MGNSTKIELIQEFCELRDRMLESICIAKLHEFHDII